jgi:hypothetical protein
MLTPFQQRTSLQQACFFGALLCTTQKKQAADNTCAAQSTARNVCAADPGLASFFNSLIVNNITYVKRSSS